MNLKTEEGPAAEAGTQRPGHVDPPPEQEQRLPAGR